MYVSWHNQGDACMQTLQYPMPDGMVNFRYSAPVMSIAGIHVALSCLTDAANTLTLPSLLPVSRSHMIHAAMTALDYIHDTTWTQQHIVGCKAVAF